MPNVDVNGYIIPETTVIAQAPYGNAYPMGIQQPQPIQYDQTPPQATPLQQTQLPSMNQQTPQASGGGGGFNGSGVTSAISTGAKAIGGIFDTIGDIRRGIITGGSALLNALIPDNPNKKVKPIQYVNSQDPYGNQQYNNMYEFGGQIAANGAKVTDYGYAQPQGLTPIQLAVLNGTVQPTYTQNVSPNKLQPSPINQNQNYYTSLPSGEFVMNIPRHLQDRLGASGRIGDAYSYGTNRAFANEGLYGNKDYIPMVTPTDYGRVFENGGTMDYQAGKTYDLTEEEISKLKSMGYDIEVG